LVIGGSEQWMTPAMLGRWSDDLRVTPGHCTLGARVGALSTQFAPSLGRHHSAAPRAEKSIHNT
jgi:hypothetical protein